MIFYAGDYQLQPTGYRAFQPNRLNRNYSLEGELLPQLLEQANYKIGELSAYSELVPDVRNFILMYVAKEATVSSRIEGTQTNLEDALLRENEIPLDKRNDWQEVQNYIAALNQSISTLNVLPLSTRLLKAAHKTLLAGARGEHKLPGEFRRSQNWIGGATLRDATFVPPVWEEVNGLMGDLENFLHDPAVRLPHLFKIALAHYQFETIHPFLDGNGRIGRLMITLYFMEKGLLKKPVLYLSDFFERNRSAYYDNLMAVRTRHDLDTWLKFFLTGVVETAEKSVEGLRKILTIKEECESQRIRTLGRKMHSAQILLSHLFKNPVIRPDEIAQTTDLSAVSAYKLLADFERLNILKEITGGQRNRVFVFEEYLNVFR
jgi:Fic family protein